MAPGHSPETELPAVVRNGAGRTAFLENTLVPRDHFVEALPFAFELVAEPVDGCLEGDTPEPVVRGEFATGSRGRRDP